MFSRLRSLARSCSESLNLLHRGGRVALAVLIGAGVALSGCGEPASSDDGEAAGETAGAAVPDSVNSLTEAERENGWMLLFDGSSFDRWRAYKSDSMPGTWVVDDGAMHFDGGDDDQADDIVTRNTYEDFELRFEWKISEGGNSGVMFHVTEEYDAPWETGPEFQILDNEGHPNGDNPKTSAGANYGLHAPSEDVTRPAGEYNESRIVVRDGRVQHFMNGTKIVDYQLGSDDWQQLVSETKFDAMPGYGQAGSGRICLQDHTDPVWFRDVKIRRLDGETPDA